MKKSTLQNRAYDYIRDRIICCEYKPGMMLSEEQICDTLSISRTPVREAIGKLEQDGLLTVRSKKGILVKEISIEDVNSVFELRILLETYAIMKYGCTIPSSVLLAWYTRIRDRDPVRTVREDFFREDDEMHLLFVSAVSNRFILDMYGAMSVMNSRLRYMAGFFNDRRIEEVRQEHLAVLKYALENNWTKASEAMECHLQNSRSIVFSYLLSEDGSSQAPCGCVKR